MSDHMLTTVDNPYDPFTQFNEWNAFDVRHGYHTLAFQARIAKVSPDLSEPDQEIAMDEAMDEIVKENVSGMWRKISKEEGETLKSKV